MTDESDGDTPWSAWLCEVVGAVHASLDSAETAAALGTAVPAELAETTGVEFAWVGTVTPDGIRVRATPPETDVPETLPIDETAETLTGIVESTGESRVADRDDHTDTMRVLERTDGDPETVLAVPLQDEAMVYGALHLHTTSSVSQPPAVLSSLGRAVGRRLRAFEEATQLTRERERLEELRSLISHDLGNPLNIASGRLELAQQNTESSHLEHAETALERVGELADQGVELVEVGHQPEEITQISVAALADDSWTDVGRDRGTMTATDATIWGDRERVRQLLDELVDNAFVHSEGDITVDIGPLESVRGFYVEDDGPGIPAEEREYVFDTGYTTVEGRDGLGFAVVTEIAGAHGWDISLTECETGGTRVAVITSRW